MLITMRNIIIEIRKSPDVIYVFIFKIDQLTCLIWWLLLVSRRVNDWTTPTSDGFSFSCWEDRGCKREEEREGEIEKYQSVKDEKGKKERRGMRKRKWSRKNRNQIDINLREKGKVDPAGDQRENKGKKKGQRDKMKRKQDTREYI